MTRFKDCAKVAHAKLRTFYPNIAIGQVQQLLAAALGHNTYASFKEADAAAFDSCAGSAMLVPDSAMLRATDFGFCMNRDHWSLLIDDLNSKQVTGALELHEHTGLLGWMARMAFQKVEDPRIADLLAPHGSKESFRQLVCEAMSYDPQTVDDGGVLPERTVVTLHGEICVYCTSYSGWAVPMLCEFAFERVGRRMYAAPVLKSVVQHGDPRLSYPAEEFDLA